MCLASLVAPCTVKQRLQSAEMLEDWRRMKEGLRNGGMREGERRREGSSMVNFCCSEIGGGT